MRETLSHDDARDRHLALAAQKGDCEALSELVGRHQAWIFHIAQRMLWNRADAEDAAQEILIKAVTRLHSFEGRSEFRTWLYRIASNHLLDCRRRAKSFEAVAETLASIPDEEIPDPNGTNMETAVLIEEAKIACTSGILLCLEPRQRMAFLVGEILGVGDLVGAEILETTPANFRQVLSRARKALYGFLQRHCGLVNEENPCRCSKKARGFIECGFVCSEEPQFQVGRLVPLRTVAVEDRYHEIQDLERQYAEIYRQQPLLSPRDHSARIHEILSKTGLQRSMGLSE